MIAAHLLKKIIATVKMTGEQSMFSVMEKAPSPLFLETPQGLCSFQGLSMDLLEKEVFFFFLSTAKSNA